MFFILQIKQPGIYDWSEYDEQLAYYLDNGFKVLAVLTLETAAPPYRQDGPGERVIEDKPRVIDAIARWCGAAG